MASDLPDPLNSIAPSGRIGDSSFSFPFKVLFSSKAMIFLTQSLGHC